MTQNFHTSEIIELFKTKNTKLTTLVTSFSELNSDIDLKVVLRKNLDIICSLIGAEAGSLWMLEKDGQGIRVEAAIGPTAAMMLNMWLNISEGIVGQVVSSGCSQTVYDVTKDSRWAKRFDEASGFTTQSAMTVPLKIRGRVLGALQLVNKVNNQLFCAEDLELAEALANQSALAIHNAQMYDEVQKFSSSAIRSLIGALEARDDYTAGHAERVSRYSVWIAEKLGLSDQKCQLIEHAALLHDVGKIAVPDDVLRKPGKLNEEEFEIIKSHTVAGEKVLADMEPEGKRIFVQQVARHHHERMDGSGYPDGLTGSQIPLYARIVAVADAFDAMTSNRPYRQAQTFGEGIRELLRCKGSQFDCELVDLFAKAIEEYSADDLKKVCPFD